MVLSDEAALGELYKLAVDCSIFPRFKIALQANIDVSHPKPYCTQLTFSNVFASLSRILPTILK